MCTSAASAPVCSYAGHSAAKKAPMPEVPCMKIGLAATRLMFRSETVSQEGFPDGPVSSRPSIRSKSSAASARAASRSSGAKSASSVRTS